MVAYIGDQIAQIEKRMEQQRQRLKDLKAQATKQERKDDTRRKILYRAAYLVGVEGLSERQKEQSLIRIHAQFTRLRECVSWSSASP